MQAVLIVSCSLSAMFAAADLGGRRLVIGTDIEIRTEFEKGIPIRATDNLLLVIHENEYALPPTCIEIIARGPWPTSWRNSPVGMATDGRIFAGVQKRSRDPPDFATVADSCAVAFFLLKKVFMCSIE